MIGIYKFFTEGLSLVWREKKLLFLIYLFNFIFAYLLTMPLSMIFSSALAKTTAADKILQAFDFTLYTSMRAHFGQGLSLGRLLLTIGLFYLVLNLFFSGGIIQTFVNREKFELTGFLKASVGYFKRFLKLFLISLIFMLSSVAVFFLLSELFGLLTKDAATEHMIVFLFGLRILILAGLLIVINMLFDYAKIMTVAHDFSGMFATVKAALIFVIQHPVKTAALYKYYLLSVILILLVYWGVESVLQVNSGLTVFVFFLLTQIYSLLKLWIRLSFFAGQYRFYAHITRVSNLETAAGPVNAG